MKRHIFKLTLFLLAGAIINVAVAWGFAICFDIYSNEYRWIETQGFSYRHVPSTWQVEWQVGFPMRALICTWDENHVVGGALTIPTPLPERFAFKGDKAFLPTGPLFAGFAINTIFYAAVLWVLFAVPMKVRRWRRIKRGQCASCGYSLRGTPHGEKCSECGATLEQKAETQKA